MTYSIIFQELDEEELETILGCMEDYGLDGYEVVKESTPESVIDMSEIDALRRLFEG